MLCSAKNLPWLADRMIQSGVIMSCNCHVGCYADWSQLGLIQRVSTWGDCGLLCLFKGDLFGNLLVSLAPASIADALKDVVPCLPVLLIHGITSSWLLCRVYLCDCSPYWLSWGVEVHWVCTLCALLLIVTWGFQEAFVRDSGGLLTSKYKAAQVRRREEGDGVRGGLGDDCHPGCGGWRQCWHLVGGVRLPPHPSNEFCGLQ